MDSWIFILILRVTIQYYFIHFIAQIVPALAIRSSFICLLYPFDIWPPLCIGFFFLKMVVFWWEGLFFNFLTLENALGSNYIFPVLFLVSAFSPWSTDSFYWWTRNQELGSRCVYWYWDLISFRFSQLTEQINIGVYTNPYIYLYVVPKVISYTHIKLNMSLYWYF